MGFSKLCGLIGVGIACGMVLLPMALGQTVDTSVTAVDAEVKARVQDIDHPDSALLPGGSNTWNGQPIMSQLPTGPGKPSASGSAASGSASASSWATFSANSSTLNSGGAAAGQNPTVAQGRSQSLLASGWSRLSAPRKLMVLSSVEQPTKVNHSADELSVEQSEGADTVSKIRMLKRSAQKTGRARTLNPFKNKADNVATGRWSAGISNARAMEQRRHEEALLMEHGFNDQTERRRRRKKGKTHTVGEH